MSRKVTAIIVLATYAVVGAAVIGLAGCASSVGGQSPTGIVVAQPGSVSGCQYLGDVYGLSSFYGVFAAPALASAREAAMKRAAEMGGTHVVWKETGSGGAGTGAAGDAFKCAK